MTNVSRPEKVTMRNKLFRIATATLEEQGWVVEKIPGFGKSSARRISKGGRTRVVSIRTSQDTWIAFPRNSKNTGWVTLSEVDAVIAVSVDNADDPRAALVHFIEGDEMRDRFDRAYAARIAATHSIPAGRGVWISLYRRDAAEPVNSVGAGAGIDNPPIARVSLHPGEIDEALAVESQGGDESKPLTIAEAKRGLALSFCVDASNIKITIQA